MRQPEHWRVNCYGYICASTSTIQIHNHKQLYSFFPSRCSAAGNPTPDVQLSFQGDPISPDNPNMMIYNTLPDVTQLVYYPGRVVKREEIKDEDEDEDVTGEPGTTTTTTR